MRFSHAIVTILITFFMSALLFSQIKTDKPQNAANKEVSLEKQVVEIFKQHCAVAGCHRGSYPKKGLNLEEKKF